jgi:hypothetical protein
MGVAGRYVDVTLDRLVREAASLFEFAAAGETIRIRRGAPSGKPAQRGDLEETVVILSREDYWDEEALGVATFQVTDVRRPF